MALQRTMPEPEQLRQGSLVGPRALKEQGTPEWCYQTLELLKVRFARKQDTTEMFEQTLREIEGARVWEKVPIGQPYGSEEALLRAELGVAGADPRSEALTIKRQQVATLAEKAEPLARHGGDHKSGTYQVNNTNLIPDATYLARRIKRDFPDIHERMRQGEYKSVRQAALEAGIVKPMVQMQPEPGPAARTLLRHLSREQVMELVQLLMQGLEGQG